MRATPNVRTDCGHAARIIQLWRPREARSFLFFDNKVRARCQIKIRKKYALSQAEIRESYCRETVHILILSQVTRLKKCAAAYTVIVCFPPSMHERMELERGPSPPRTHHAPTHAPVSPQTAPLDLVAHLLPVACSTRARATHPPAPLAPLRRRRCSVCYPLGLC